MKTLTKTDVKLNNHQNILHYIYDNKDTSLSAIADDLQLSRPTVSQIVKACEEDGFIVRNGYYESTGGRKANSIHFIADYKIAIGVELLKDEYSITALDLYGDMLSVSEYHLSFENCDLYYRKVCTSILQFIDSLSIPSDKILGIGIVLQGLISSDSKQVTYGKILNCTGLTTDSFSKYLPYPCSLYHDAEAAAEIELLENPFLENAIFMHIRQNMSGAIIVNRKFLKGSALKSGVFEHMTIVPNGRSCYCGNQGCMDAYCSLHALLPENMSIDEFFYKLSGQDPTITECWDAYLHYLAMAINNLHMFMDYPIIIGGTLAKYLNEDTIHYLHQLVKAHTAFPSETDFIRISHHTSSQICRGAAIPYIRAYLKSIFGRDI